MVPRKQKKKEAIHLGSIALAEWNTVIRWCELPGEGPPLVCLPGLSFAAIPNLLPLMTQPEFRGRRILMIDYVGSGYSGHSESFGFGLKEHSQSIATVMEATCSEPAHLLGYSMGGAVAISVALARPDLVSKLVICEGNLKPGGGEASKRIASSDQDTFISKDHPERMKRLSEAALNGDAFSDFMCMSRTEADPRGIHGNARALVELADDFVERFLSLTMERHYIYGEEGFPGHTGKVTPDLPAPDLLQANGVGIHVVPGVGHGMMIEDPVATAKVLGRVLT